MDLNKRPEAMERISTPELAEQFIAEQIAAVREQVGDKKVLLALSGGVDSSVVAALLVYFVIECVRDLFCLVIYVCSCGYVPAVFSGRGYRS